MSPAAPRPSGRTRRLAAAVSSTSPGRRYTSSGTLYADIEVGLPLTGRNNLAEGPLLQCLGDLRWRHLSHLSGRPAAQIFDAAGRRLYPTFSYVEMAFGSSRPLAAFGLDDRIKVVSDLKRFETSLLDGTFYLLPPDAAETPEPPWPDVAAATAAGVPAVRLSNIFAAQSDGAGSLKRSCPADPGFERIPEMTGTPDGFTITRHVARHGCFASPPRGYAPLTRGVSRVTYPLVPDRDVNGTGLVYFANYPTFLDIAERETLIAAAWPLTDALCDRRTLVRRRSAYLNNAGAHDTLLIDVEAWIANPFTTGETAPDHAPIRLWLNFRMYRRSDERLMMVSTAEKIVCGHTLTDVPFFDAMRTEAIA